MNARRSLPHIGLVALTLALAPRDTSAQQPVTPRDGQHDFDFEIAAGRFTTHAFCNR